MVCLWLKPGAAGWKVQTNQPSYGLIAFTVWPLLVTLYFLGKTISVFGDQTSGQSYKALNDRNLQL